MKRLQTVCLVTAALALLLTGFGSSPVFAEDLLSTIKKNGKFTVGTSADYPPYESVDDSGKFVGFDMDLIREVAKRMGVEVEIKDMGFDTLIAAVQNRKIDMIIAALQGTPERDKTVDFSIPYHFVKDAFVTSKQSGIKMKTAMDAAGKPIGVQTGSIQEKWIQDNLVKKGLTKEDQLFRYERVDNAALDIKAGRIDLLLIQSKPARELAKKLDLEVALITTETIAAGQCIALPEGEATLKAELDRIIEELKKDGWIEKKSKEFDID